MTRPSIVAWVPGAGSGIRLGEGPKAFLTLHGRSLLQHTVGSLVGCVDRIIVGVPASYLQQARLQVGDVAEVVAGGSTRIETLDAMRPVSRESFVLIHNACAPFASRRLIEDVVSAGFRHGVAVAVTTPRVPVANLEAGVACSVAIRRNTRLLGTPLVMTRQHLDAVFAWAAERPKIDLTPSEILLTLGVSIFPIEDEPRNLKITTPLDWEIAQRVLADGLTDVNGT